MSYTAKLISDVEQIIQDEWAKQHAEKETIRIETDRQIDQFKQVANTYIQEYREKQIQEMKELVASVQAETMMQQQQEIVSIDQAIDAQKERLIQNILEEVKQRYGSF